MNIIFYFIYILFYIELIGFQIYWILLRGVDGKSCIISFAFLLSFLCLCVWILKYKNCFWSWTFTEPFVKSSLLPILLKSGFSGCLSKKFKRPAFFFASSLSFCHFCSASIRACFSSSETILVQKDVSLIWPLQT